MVVCSSMIRLLISCGQPFGSLASGWCPCYSAAGPPVAPFVGVVRAASAGRASVAASGARQPRALAGRLTGNRARCADGATTRDFGPAPLPVYC